MTRRIPGSGRLRHRVGEAIRDHGLWERGQKVAVAVSGGADSVALLELLWCTRGWHGARLEVVTVDHGLRPGSADDAAFVWGLARAKGLPCTWSSLGLPAGASEDVCRRARYEVFEALDVDRIALAHHREDQAETVLLNLVRGTGVRGVAGMARRRDRYVRPLLDLSRVELREFLAWVGATHREDPTNQDRSRLRNLLRHDVLPRLEAARPGATLAIARSADTIRAEVLPERVGEAEESTGTVDATDPGV